MSYVPRAYTKTPVPTAAELHLMNRMGTGYSRSTLAQMRAAGGPPAWFVQQLVPGKIVESAKALELEPWYSDQTTPPLTKWNQFLAIGTRESYYSMRFGARSILRRVYSNRPVLHTMVDFWADHLHVPSAGEICWPSRSDYEAMLFTRALGKFEDLLVAATLHPAMQLFLDNWRSQPGAPNENQGRELLELHTVGRGAHYTEDMVKASARILSGYTLHWPNAFDVYYNPNLHTTGPVTVLGFSEANASADGRAMCDRYLRYLARHPATARNIATKLALKFVSDTPSPALVDHLAYVYTSSGTSITAVLKALVESSEFLASAGQKVRTPIEDFVATIRVLGIQAHAGNSDTDFAVAAHHYHGSIPPYLWPRPDGSPAENAAWCGASRVKESLRTHWALSAGWWPTSGATLRAKTSWVPQSPMRFDLYVDHMSRSLLGRRSTATLLKRCCLALDRTPSSTVTRTSHVATWAFPFLTSCLFDSPQHMYR